jgi:hypothetical protein
MKFAYFLFLISFSCFYSKAQTTYYISFSTGSDSNNGTTLLTPWQTLSKVNAYNFLPGDKVLFKGGDSWQGSLIIKKSGSLNNPITFDKYGTGRPVIYGNGAKISNFDFKTEAVIFAYNAQYLVIRSFEVTNYNPTPLVPNNYRRGVQLELDGKFYTTTNTSTAYNIILDSLFVHNVNGELTDNSVPGGKGIFCHVAATKTGETPVTFSDITISNCIVDSVDRVGINVRSDDPRRNFNPVLNVKIKNNSTNNTAGSGILVSGCKDAVIEYNNVRYSGARDKGVGIWPFNSDNTLIQYNDVRFSAGDTDAQGYDSDYNCRNSIFQYNYSEGNEGGFILICVPGEIYNSPENDNEQINIGNSGTIVRYNVSVNDGNRHDGPRAGFSPTFHITGPLKNTQIYNNTIYIGPKTSGAEKVLVKMINWGGKAIDWPDSTFFYNNIFYVTEATAYEMGSATHTVFNNNLYFGTHTGRPTDNNAILADPKLFSAGLTGGNSSSNAYKLLDNSPALLAGKRLDNNGGKDFYGNSVLSSNALNPKPNVGAYNGLGLSAVIYEAENATLTGVTINSCSNASAGKIVTASSGTGRVTFGNITSSSVSNYKLRISYYATVSRTITFSINGATPVTLPIVASGLFCSQGGVPALYETSIALNAGNNSIEFSESPLLDKIQLIESPTALPIYLVDFSADVKENHIRLNWQTATESNNQYFEIFKSGDENAFKTLKKVEGAGNSNSPKFYSFTDYNPLMGINYYLLKQYDTDGKSTSFKPIAVEFGKTDEELKLLSVSDAGISVAINTNKPKQGILSFVEIDGRVVFQKEFQLATGMNTLNIPVPASTIKRLSIISFTSGLERKSLKVIR